MKPLHLLLSLAALATTTLHAAEKFAVHVTHTLDIARPAEVISLPWSEVSIRLPGVAVDHIVVRDPAGKIIPAQTTNFQPELKTGHVDELLFQHSFAAGEKSAIFTIEKTDAPVPPFAPVTFGRYAPERFDDFIWENDRVGHRMYGPALDTEEPKKWGSGRLRSSGIDVWCKRVRYPVVNRWLLKGHDNYHIDTGEGLDMYDVGTTRGCGGLGIWSGDKLYTSGNYKTWKVLANGPVRTVFELTYETWDAAGLKVSEVKRLTVDAGSNLDQIESKFTVEGEARALIVGLGLGKQGKSSHTDATRTHGTLALWHQYPEKLAHFGQVGTAIVLDPALYAGDAEDKENHLLLARVSPGETLRYHAGAGWSKSGDFPAQQDWLAYVAAFAARAASPVSVSFATPAAP